MGQSTYTGDLFANLYSSYSDSVTFSVSMVETGRTSDSVTVELHPYIWYGGSTTINSTGSSWKGFYIDGDYVGSGNYSCSNGYTPLTVVTRTIPLSSLPVKIKLWANSYHFQGGSSSSYMTLEASLPILRPPTISLNYTGTTIEVTVSQDVNGPDGTNHWDSSYIEWTYEGETWDQQGYARRTNFNSYTWIFEISDSSWYYNPFHIWFRVYTQHSKSASPWGYANIDNVSFKAAPSSPPTLMLRDNNDNTTSVSWNWNEAPARSRWDEIAIEYSFSGETWGDHPRKYIYDKNTTSWSFPTKAVANQTAYVRGYVSNTSGSSSWSSTVAIPVKYYTNPTAPTNCKFIVHENEHKWEMTGTPGQPGMNNTVKGMWHQYWDPKANKYVNYIQQMPYIKNDNNTELKGRLCTVGNCGISQFENSPWTYFTTTLIYYEDLDAPNISINIDQNTLSLSYPQPANKLNNNVKSVYVEWGTSTSATTLPTAFKAYNTPVKLEEKLDKQYIFVRGITKGTHHDSQYSNTKNKQFNYYYGFVQVWDNTKKQWIEKSVYIYKNNQWIPISSIQTF